MLPIKATQELEAFKSLYERVKVHLRVIGILICFKRFLRMNLHDFDVFIQVRPIPLAISVAKKGIEAKPTSSILIINLNLETKLLDTLGN